MPYLENGVWRPHDWRDWEIELIDGSLDTIGLLDEVVGPTFDWACFGYGMGAFSLHIESERATDLLAQDQFYFRFLRDGARLRDFMLAKDDRGYTVADQVVDEYIEITLAPLEQILANHPCQPENGTGQLTSPSLPYDDALKWIVDHVVGPNAYDVPGGGSRSIAGLTIAAYDSAHPTSAEVSEAHGMDLFEFLQKYGVNLDVDWQVRLARTTGNANEMVFETFYPVRGLDKTYGNGARQPVILNDASGEVRQARRWRPATGFVNVVILEGGQSEIRDDASVAIYGRRELRADTSEVKKAQAVLEERGQRLGDEVDFNESEMMEVGTGALDIQPGDIITIGNHHLGIDSHDEMVQSIKLTLADDGTERPQLTFGRYEKKLGDKTSESSGGGGDGGYYSPIIALMDDVGTIVPMSNGDFENHVQLTTDANLSATGNVGSNLIALAMTDVINHPLIGKHTASGLTAGHVLRATGVDSFAFGAIQSGDLPDLSGTYVPVTRTVTAGSGLTGGGALSANISLALGNHALVGGVHTASGLTAGHVLRATAATTFAFGAIESGDLPDLSGTYSVVGHTHDHGTLTGRGDDDHTQYLLASGARALTAQWNANWPIRVNPEVEFIDANTYISNTGSQLVIATDHSRINLAPGSAGEVYVEQGVMKPQDNNVTDLAAPAQAWKNLYLAGNITMAATKTVDGVDVSAHTHSISTESSHRHTVNLISKGVDSVYTEYAGSHAHGGATGAPV
jgi:hypothetical protein